ncbi:glycine/D-amino acid oxidase-like deaminating enzyme [Mobilisporobacter senegalensis]|uniref:Glycine/D-amino acid oxidase-like deaminating enzyme n=1 Tax=Mobilisporobacter senegalensis TaxID=1329262 RepID=A0A3N1Y3K3_9FIRM|nr:FAD-dependent oxidoreductase [Mobilisporobacter senegalensis]ROR31857.1 glycine/D-amino acid oxidase-like deaminating enzyme [Mobilisporobacter senegalensis]
MKSVWSDEVSFEKKESLEQDIKVDTVVIGAGIAGILTGYLLQEQGIEVIIIEGNQIASGVTKNTTAKITSQHDLIYHKLIDQIGVDQATWYAFANQKAIETYKEIISKENIDCEFEEKSSYIYSRENQEIIEQEVEAASRVGILADFVAGLQLPFDTKAAIRFNGQAQFNPLKFLLPLSKKLTIYENTLAVHVEKNTVYTSKAKIVAKHIIVATHYPFINIPGYYFMRMHQERSYVIALECGEGDPEKLVFDSMREEWNLDGMYLDADKDGYSFRTYKNLLLLGGSGHRTGENHIGGCYERLREKAREWYPNARERYHWSAQDCMTLDSIPYIGLYSSSTPNMYVATGFKKWGMTSSMVSAMIIRDRICGNENDYMEVFSPQRFHLSASATNLMKDGAKSVAGLTKGMLKIPKEKLEELPSGHGGIVEYEGEKYGVYKDEEGECFFVSAKCAHLGCQLEWNPDELTWDCPCHGSRYDIRGKVISNPAINDIGIE